jgi:O-antigen ligase/polysaccharide polymerase Wzy-like membrane protein
MLIKKPFLGWGIGTFPIVYPEFRSFYTNSFVNQAHNDDLQLLVETGLPGFSIAVWFLLLVFRQPFPRLYYRTQELTGKAKIILASCGEVGFRCPAPKGHLISENSRPR